MDDVTPRLERRVRRDFPSERADEVLGTLSGLRATLPLAGKQSSERLQASLVIRSDGDYDEFLSRLRLARRDWRDALVAAGLAHGDWHDVLDSELGSEPSAP